MFISKAEFVVTPILSFFSVLFSQQEEEEEDGNSSPCGSPKITAKNNREMVKFNTHLIPYIISQSLFFCEHTDNGDIVSLIPLHNLFKTLDMVAY